MTVNIKHDDDRRVTGSCWLYSIFSVLFFFCVRISICVAARQAIKHTTRRNMLLEKNDDAQRHACGG